MKRGNVLAGVLLASALGAGLVVGGDVAGAAAAAAPPVGLGFCGHDEAPFGGWGHRDIVATGTKATEPSPVRPVSIRLAEPCWDDLDGVRPERHLAVPYRMASVPVPHLDTDDDGIDDGAPDVEADPSWDASCVTAVGQTVCASVLQGSYQQLWKPSGTWHHMTYLCLSVTGTPTSSFRLNVELPPVPVGFTGTAASFAVNSWTSGAILAAYTGPVGFTGGQYTPSGTYTCPASVTHTLLFRTQSSPGTEPPPRGFPLRLGMSYLDGPIGWSDQRDVHLGHDYFGGTQGADFVVGADSTLGPFDSIVTCATNFSGTEGLVTHDVGASLRSVPALPQVADPEHPEDAVWEARTAVHFLDLYAADCPYLVMVELSICVYTDYGPENRSCTLFTWSADVWMSRNGYEAGSGLEYICTYYPDTDGCFAVLNPPYVDGTDFNAVCPPSSFPSGPLTDVDVLRAWIGHLAECLFVPVNGWDGRGDIARAVATGTLAEIVELLEEFFVQFQFAPACGEIVTVADPTFGLSMNTCEWESWAVPIRDIAYWIVLLGWLFWAISFVIDTVLSIPNRHTPNPVKDAAK